MEIMPCDQADGAELAELRERAMRPSLEAVGRYDPVRVKQRFLSTFNPENTKKIMCEGCVAGFFVLLDKADHIYLDHLYIDPAHQSKKLGAAVLSMIIEKAQTKNKPIRLGALKQSRANKFYLAHGFQKTHDGEFDHYYELTPRSQASVPS